LLPADTPLAYALRTYAAQQLAEVDTQLSRPGNLRHSGIHEARKFIRRFRAVLQLCGSNLDIATERVDHAARSLGKSLSTLRDAHVVVQLATKRLKGTALSQHRSAWRQLRDSLKHRRSQLTDKALGSDPDFSRRRRAALKLAERFAALARPDTTPETVLIALRESSARVRRAERGATKDPSLANRHRWRRRARRLRMQLQCIAELAHRDDTPKDVQVPARWVLREALDTMPSIDALDALTTALGTEQDLSAAQSRARDARPSVANGTA